MSFYDELTDDETELPRRDYAGMILPFAAAGVSLAAGALVGILGGYMVGVAQAPTAEVAADVINADDIAFAKVCAPIQQEAETQIEQLNYQIEDLASDIATRKAKVLALQAEMDQRADAGKKLWRELKETKESLAIAMQEKTVLEEEKEQLVYELTRTVQALVKTEEALDEQVELTEHYRYESLDHNFERFVNESQLAICEKGNRKKLGSCREVVTTLLVAPDVQNRFRHCIKSGQETPGVALMGKEEGLPEFSGFLDQDNRIVRDWYVHLCDPTLPENDTLLADAVMDLHRDG